MFRLRTVPISLLASNEWSAGPVAPPPWEEQPAPPGPGAGMAAPGMNLGAPGSPAPLMPVMPGVDGGVDGEPGRPSRMTISMAPRPSDEPERRVGLSLALVAPVGIALLGLAGGAFLMFGVGTLPMGALASALSVVLALLCRVALSP